ncbi:hypothetical protein [Nostoc sp.]|uniref:hypothetical protein n=1 Tax=Nostoc sp. TaxID=1180 RepID=UPI002FFC63D1
MAVSVDSAALASHRASGGLLNPKGGRVSRHKASGVQDCDCLTAMPLSICDSFEAGDRVAN